MSSAQRYLIFKETYDSGDRYEKAPPQTAFGPFVGPILLSLWRYPFEIEREVLHEDPYRWYPPPLLTQGHLFYDSYRNLLEYL